MAGLLDFLQTEEGRLGLGLLAASGPRSDGMGAGGRIQEAFSGQEARKDAAMKRQYQQSQMENYASEIEERKLKGEREQSAQTRRQALLYGGGQGGAQGGAVGIVELARQYGIPEQVIQAEMEFNGGKKIAELISERSAPKWQNIGGNLVDTNAQGFSGGFQPSLSISASGQATLSRPDGRGGVVVGAPQGALETYGAYKGMDAGLGAAAKINLRKNADGTESPVSELTENPTLQGLLGGRMGAPAGYASEPQMKTTVQSMAADQAGNPAAIQREIKATQNDLMKPLDAASRAQLQAHLTDLRAQSADPRNAARPGAPAGAPSYGMTNEQVIANKAKEEAVVGTAKADVQGTQARQAGMDGATNAYKLIDKALAHPGLSTATGLSGTIDPRNYWPGSDAKNFDSVAKQLQGNAFLSAFAQLKGAGQITEVEGTKATAAIARLQQAQSTEEYKAALKDYQSVIGQGLKRMGVDPATLGGGTNGSWGDKKATLSDIQATARASGKSTEEVTRAMRAAGYKIGGQ